MTHANFFAPLLVWHRVLGVALCALAMPAFAYGVPLPVFILDGAVLNRTKQVIRSGDAALAPATMQSSIWKQ